MIKFADIFKKSFLEKMGNLTFEDFVLSMLMAFVCGIVIYLIYRFFYQGIIYNHNFNILLVLTCLVTCFIVMVISSNVVLSLGMVGALSIVRFRSAIKEPLDTGFMFWSIACGITTGAGLYLISLFAVFFISIVFIVLTKFKGARHTYLLIIRGSEDVLPKVQEVLETVKKILKNKTTTRGIVELTYEIKIKMDHTEFVEQISALDGVESVSVIEFAGDFSA